MLRHNHVTWHPKDPDEQELLYNTDPEYEWYMDEEMQRKELIQQLLMRREVLDRKEAQKNADRDTGQAVSDNEQNRS